VNRRTLASVLGVGIAGSQAGHLLAYQIRFGAAAQQVQGTAGHAYFPSLAKTVLGLVAVAAVVAVLVIGLTRVIGRRIEKDSALPYLRLLAALFTIQLALFALQETAESAASAPVLLLWGTLGQLPVAAVAALALRWLFARLRPALAQLRASFATAFQLMPSTPAVLVWAPAMHVVSAVEPFAAGFNRRGPPS
jgi:hypothetical protein